MNLEEHLELTSMNEPPGRSSTEASSALVSSIIENPVINSPYVEPRQHFVFDIEGITNQISQGRRASTFFIPIAPPKRKDTQLQIEGLMTADRMRPNALINRTREKVTLWRQGGYWSISSTTRRLLDHWLDHNRDISFCICFRVLFVYRGLFVWWCGQRGGD